jgi:hypothetical protein
LLEFLKWDSPLIWQTVGLLRNAFGCCKSKVEILFPTTLVGLLDVVAEDDVWELEVLLLGFPPSILSTVEADDWAGAKATGRDHFGAITADGKGVWKQ